MTRFWWMAWFGLLGWLVLSLLAIIRWGDPNSFDTALTLLLFLGLLPLFNAPLDWLSFGVTRGLLQAIASGTHTRGWALLWACADVVLAMLFLLLVAASTAGGIALMNEVSALAGGPPVVDLGQLWLQLQWGGWRANLWIWLMLGSTLLPTMVHLIVAAYALALWFPMERSRWAARKLAEARAEFKAREAGTRPGNPGDVVVDTDARRRAFIHLQLARLVTWGGGTVLVVALVYLFFIHLPGFVSWMLALVRP